MSADTVIVANTKGEGGAKEEVADEPILLWFARTSPEITKTAPTIIYVR